MEEDIPELLEEVVLEGGEVPDSALPAVPAANDKKVKTHFAANLQLQNQHVWISTHQVPVTIITGFLGAGKVLTPLRLSLGSLRGYARDLTLATALSRGRPRF